MEVLAALLALIAPEVAVEAAVVEVEPPEVVLVELVEMGLVVATVVVD
jgi:hypothetical protein